MKINLISFLFCLFFYAQTYASLDGRLASAKKKITEIRKNINDAKFNKADCSTTIYCTASCKSCKNCQA